MIPRLIQDLVIESLKLKKVILILGARQVGKTTLVKEIQKKLEDQRKVLYLNCDLDEEKASINITSITLLSALLKNIDVLIIDEAQRLENAGLTLKILHDNFPKVFIIATGSSSFELKNNLSDPLTGRYIDFTLYPLSLAEILASQNVNPPLQKAQSDALLPTMMLFGCYPEVFNEGNPKTKQLFLEKITESYLFKDILYTERVRNPQAIKDLTKALSYQLSSEVNENELSNRLKIDRKTVVSYLDILEKAFVIVKVYPFSKNPRREIGKNYKVYFADLGVRNALIGDFNGLALRQDTGALWENFLFIERLKTYANSNKKVPYYFWRSYSGAEVDYIEQSGSKLKAFEFKYSGDRLSKGAHSFELEYATAVKLINLKNYLDFVI